MISAAKYASNKYVIGGVVLLVVLLILIWKMKGGSLINIFNPTPLPNKGSTGVELTSQEAQMVRALSQKLFTDMNQWNNPWFATRDQESWMRFLELDDRLFMAVNNDFGNLYYSKEGKTLKEWIESENFSATWTYSPLMVWGIYRGGQVKDMLLSRMNSLNIQ